MITVNEIRKLNDQYFQWLRDKTTLRGLQNGWTELTTPYLDRHNDCLQIYIKPEDNGIRLTDDGYIIDDLRVCGCDIDSPKRQAVLREMIAGFGVKYTQGRLESFGSKQDFPQLKHDLVQAMLSINDMFYLSTSYVSALFYEDAAAWLDAAAIRFTPDVTFKGKSGFNYHFFGVIPKSHQSPERIIQPINNPDRNTVQKLIFEWDDTKETRPNHSIIYPILNDIEKPVRPELVAAFDSYGITCITWSAREQFKDALAS